MRSGAPTNTVPASSKRTAPHFSFRRKRYFSRRAIEEFRRKSPLHRLKRRVIIIAGSQIRAKEIFCLRPWQIRQRYHRIYFHLAVRDRSRLVQTEHVHMCQRLQRIDVLNQNSSSSRAGMTPGSQGNGDQQHKSFRKHSQQCRRKGYNRFTERHVAQHEGLKKQKYSQRNDQKTGKARHLPHGNSEARTEAAFPSSLPPPASWRNFRCPHELPSHSISRK